MNITCEFLGRLGNNFFQVAAMIGYCKTYGGAWGIPPGYHHRQIYRHWRMPVYRGNIRRLPVYDMATDAGWAYSPIPKFSQPTRIRGFFQSHKHFQHADAEVKAALRLDIKPVDMVSIHVRRGDYVKYSNDFPPVNMDYINQAIDIFRQKGKMRFMVFSDDMHWCRANLSTIKDAEFHYIEGGNEFNDLSMMASCSDHIIANSTFSWWGAYLGHNPDKTVVTPSRLPGNWFGHERLDTTHLLPEDWVQIKFR